MGVIVNLVRVFGVVACMVAGGLGQSGDYEDDGTGLAAGHEDILTRAYNPEAFSCDGQDYGYYADVESGCEIFHICLPIQDNEGVVTSTTKWSFFCGNGTIFDQQALVCNWPEAAFPCEESPSLFGSVAFGEVLEEDY